MIVSLIGYVPLVVIIIAIFVKYPIRTFMRAKALALSPLPNKRLNIIGLSDDKELARTSDGSFIFTKPDHFFIESKTRKPIVLVDETIGQTINLDGYRLMNVLRDNGFENYNQIIKAVKENPEAMIVIGGKEMTITDAMIDGLKKHAKDGTRVIIDGVPITLNEDLINEIAKNGKVTIKIGGESLQLSNAVEYFNQSIPGTVIETMLQYRSTVESLRQKRKDIMQWIVILGFFVICIGFAVLLISHAAPPAANVAANLGDVGAKTATTGLT